MLLQDPLRMRIVGYDGQADRLSENDRRTGTNHLQPARRDHEELEAHDFRDDRQVRPDGVRLPRTKPGRPPCHLYPADGSGAADRTGRSPGASPGDRPDDRIP